MAEANLEGGDIALTGRITSASNATFLGTIDDIAVVYKPVAGEQPLWDFPEGGLAQREVAAYLVSESFGWNVVPRTWMREGPFGRGMVQLWQEIDPEQGPVDVVPADAVPDVGWRRVFEGVDGQGRAVALIHEDSHELRRMAVFDVVVNNADRKGAHVLAMADGHRHGVDHGLTFHTDHKLRTVLWGWVNEGINDEERDGIDRVRSALAGALGDALRGLISDLEIEALAQRCERLLSEGRFPAPHGDMPATPWPLF
ncbi:SCO1664 family protein [Homoserinimonas sp. OAct 916]|uniref:SCO1664 family protein n=1 Tax=Homoserinimonas sp. OAct 916 TaxID=2211450 RepID=UPI000DBE19A1|nr:SCO1664 family protein [Homoserinimonas sp. OAct 916]